MRLATARGALLLALVCFAAALMAGLPRAWAVKAIELTDVERLEISGLGEGFDGRGDTWQMETAPGPDGTVGRVVVHAATPGTNPSWFVFALTNNTDKTIERWLVSDRYGTVGTGVVWPDLDARRLDAVTPSVGFVPERIKNDRADVFRLTVEPGTTVTYAVELASDRFARLFLWKALEYEQKSRDRQLFNGIMLGITGLLAIFLTAVYAANHKAIFPAAAVFTWCVLAYLCVDFGFWSKLFGIRPEENAQYRAAAEAAMAASLLVFLHTFLRLGAWHGFVRTLFALWIAVQLALVGLAFIDPRLAATFARLSMIAMSCIGALLILFLALRGQDRALSLVPTWMLLVVWLFGAGATFIGRLSGDIVVFGLTAGLVLIVVLIGFTVTQYAFRSVEPTYGAQPGEQQLRALAVDGAGAAVWEWSARRDEIKVSPVVEAMLGLKSGVLSARTEVFGGYMHPADGERFKVLLGSMQERAEGEMRIEFRMRHADNSYRWLELEAAGVPTTDRRNVRYVGLLRDVTDTKRAQERLLHDAVHDSLTRLPNRELFLDRLAIAAKRATLEPLVRPAVLFIDIDKFKSVNSSFGLIVGDSLLLTVARRLGRNLGPQDTLGRVGGDQFALLLLSQGAPRELAMLAEQVRRSLRAPIAIAGQEIVLTASIGIALYDGPDEDPAELLREAEIAMYRAKRGGSDRIEIFNADMRTEKDGRVAIEADLRRAIDKRQLRLVYQPIFYLPTESLAGFEAVMRWEHPTLGTLNPTSFVPVAEESDLIVKLGSYSLSRAVRDAARWQRDLPRPDSPLFVSVNIASRQLFTPDLVNEVRHLLARAVIPRGSLRLEVAEALVMDNPEKATEVLRQLAEVGAGLSLDDFGTGYSSLSYLNQFTFDTIKVERSFIQATSQNGSGSVILRSVVALAHELGKKVVAEGVETEEDVGFLRTIGCEYGQGPFFGEPMSEREVMQLLKSARRSERRQRRKLFGRRIGSVPVPEANVGPVPIADSGPPIPHGAERMQAASPSPEQGAPPPSPSPQPVAGSGPKGPMPPGNGSVPLSGGGGGSPPSPLSNGRGPASPPAGAGAPPPIANGRGPAPQPGAGGPPPMPGGPAGARGRPMPPSPPRPNGGSQPQPRAASDPAAIPPTRPTVPPGLRPANGSAGGPPRPGGPPPLPPAQGRPMQGMAPPAPAGGGGRPPPPGPGPAPPRGNGGGLDLTGLPPSIAESLAKLAGRPGGPTKPEPPTRPEPAPGSKRS